MKEIECQPLVTVAVAIYNVQNYISQCIDSIINQTYQNIEILLVDDGTPDSSGEIADDYALKDKRIVVVHQKNKGLGGARNTAIDMAKGDYITFVDADDYLAPDFVDYMMGLIKSKNAEIAFSRNCFTTSDLKQVKDENVTEYSSAEAVAEFFLPYVQLGAWNKIYDMKFINSHSLRFVPELTTGEGLQFITHAASLANLIVAGSRKVYIYRLNNAGSATSAANVERQGIGSLVTMDYIKKNLPLLSKIEKDAFEWHLWNCYRYCLRQIVESGTRKEYNNLFSECKQELRRRSPKVIFSNMKIRYRIEAFVVLVSPVFYSKLQIWKKKVRQK